MRLRLKQQRLVELLAGSALSQNHWALKVGISRGHWSEIVNGKHPYPSAKTRVLMLDALHIPVEDLFDIEVGLDPLADVDFRRASRTATSSTRSWVRAGWELSISRATLGTAASSPSRSYRPEAVSGIGLTQFHREISTIAQLQHQNILPLHDSGDAAGTPPFM